MKLQIVRSLANAISGIPLLRRANVALRSEPANASSSSTASNIQSAIRAAESGDTSMLFTLYRDLTLGGSHIQSEFNKRLLAVLAQPLALLPSDKSNADDILAAKACQQAMQDCENWNDALTHLLSATVWPVAVVEKIFRPVAPNEAQRTSELKLRYTLRRLEPVNPQLLCFQQPASALSLDPDAWEPNLRFFGTDNAGIILYDPELSYAPDAARHLVHRGHLLAGVRDNFGGPMRAILAWWLLGALGRDWFARLMERYGNPFIVARADATNREAVDFLSDALSLSTKLGGLVVDEATQIELKEAMVSSAAGAYETFLGVCNREISKLIVGQELSSTSDATGLGSGVANLHAAVREDIRVFDQMRLGETIQKQLFAPFLQINGLRGAPPKPVWGGLSDADAASFANLLKTLSDSGFEPTDDAMPVISERLGLQVRRRS